MLCIESFFNCLRTIEKCGIIEQESNIPRARAEQAGALPTENTIKGERICLKRYIKNWALDV